MPLTMWRRRVWMTALLTVACGCSDGGPIGGAGGSMSAGGPATNGMAGTAASGNAGSGGAPVGGASGTSGVGGASASAGAGGMSAADVDAGAQLDGATPIDDALVAAVPVEACDEDVLDAQVGVVRPDYGSAQSGGAFSGDLDDDGAFDVLTVDVTIPNPDASRAALDATFYAPSTDGSSVAAGAHPLALVMHGFGTTHRTYAHFTQHLASHGLMVLGITLPFSLTAAHDKNASEALAAIDFALGDDAPQAVRGHVDAERIAALGHSFGGKIAFYAAALDARIDLVVGWDPSNAGGPPCFIDANGCNQFPVAPNCLANDSGLVHQLQAETLVLRAAPDGANPEAAHNAIHFYRGAPAPATLVDFGANVAHGDFANAAAPVLPHTRRVHLAFLLSRFLGTTGLEDYLPGGAKLADDARVEQVLSR